MSHTSLLRKTVNIGILNYPVTQINRLQENHAHILSSREQMATNLRQQLKQLQELEQERSDEIDHLRRHVGQLGYELKLQRDNASTSHEALLIKEAELARLGSQLSGYQRAEINTTNSKSSNINDQCAIDQSYTTPTSKAYQQRPQYSVAESDDGNDDHEDFQKQQQETNQYDDGHDRISINNVDKVGVNTPSTIVFEAINNRAKGQFQRLNYPINRMVAPIMTAISNKTESSMMYNS